jgi:hypothetical protein
MTQIAWTYNTLTSALQIWLDDTDPDWVAAFTPPSGAPGTAITAINLLIQLGEQKIVDDFDLTIFDVLTTVPLTFPLATGLVGRPAGLLVTDDLGYQVPSGPSAGKYAYIERRDYSWLQDYRDPAVTGPPKYYAEADSNNWLIGPSPDQAYTLVTYGPNAAQSLLDVGPTVSTWLSQNLSQLMIHACLMEAARFLKNNGKLQEEQAAYNEKVGPMKLRLRALRRNTVESPRLVSQQMPEGQLPASREGSQQ